MLPKPRWRPVYQVAEWVRYVKPVHRPADGGEEPVAVPERVLATESVLEPVTGEPLPEPLPAERLPSEESAPRPVPERRPRWRPVYQVAAGSLLVMVALGLFIIVIWYRAPQKETNVKGTGTVVAEQGSTLPVLATQDQGLVPAPSARVKREKPRRLADKKQEPPQPVVQKQQEPPQPLHHNQPNGADPDDLLLKQDAAWRVLQR